MSDQTARATTSPIGNSSMPPKPFAPSRVVSPTAVPPAYPAYQAGPAPQLPPLPLPGGGALHFPVTGAQPVSVQTVPFPGAHAPHHHAMHQHPAPMHLPAPGYTPAPAAGPSPQAVAAALQEPLVRDMLRQQIRDVLHERDMSTVLTACLAQALQGHTAAPGH